jgi:hypothetical protein
MAVWTLVGPIRKKEEDTVQHVAVIKLPPPSIHTSVRVLVKELQIQIEIQAGCSYHHGNHVTLLFQSHHSSLSSSPPLKGIQAPNGRDSYKNRTYTTTCTRN